MLDALILLLLLHASVYGLDCSQVALKTASSGIGILAALDVSYSGLHDQDLLVLPECFRSPLEFSSIQVLNLQGNQLSGQYLSSLLARLPNLQYLYLKSNPLAGLDGSLLQAARKLQFLDISETPLRAVAPDLLYPVSESLLSLIMEKTHLEYLPDGFFGYGIEHGQWVLQNLSLSGNIFLTSLPDNIFHQLISLQSIDVSGTGINCYPSSTLTNLSKSPPSLPACSPLMRQWLLSAPEIFATERAIFRLDLDYNLMTVQTRSDIVHNLITDISDSIGVQSSLIVNVQLGPSRPSSTTAQLDIINAGIPTAKDVVSAMRNQSMIQTSAFRTGSVTSHIILSSSIISIPAQVRKCSSALFIDVSGSCPPENQSGAFYSSSRILVYFIIAICLVVLFVAIRVIRDTARHRSEKRLRDAMKDVFNLSLEQDVVVVASPSARYIEQSPTIRPSDYPVQPVSTSVSDSESRFDRDQPIEIANKFVPPRLTKAQSTVTLVKRPGLNAIRSKKMLLATSGDADDSMPDTDAEF